MVRKYVAALLIFGAIAGCSPPAPPAEDTVHHMIAKGDRATVNGYFIQTAKVGKCWYFMIDGDIAPLMEPETAHDYGGSRGTERQVCDRD